MFSDAAGTMPIPNPATVRSGTQIWLSSTGPSSGRAQATAKATVPTGNVYLYDGTRAAAAPEAHPGGDGHLDRHRAGHRRVSASRLAGRDQDDRRSRFRIARRVYIHVACDDGVDKPDVNIPTGTPAGTTSHTYADIPAGTVCTVTETANGSTLGTNVVVTGDGQQVTIPSATSKAANVTNTYDSSRLAAREENHRRPGRSARAQIHTEAMAPP